MPRKIRQLKADLKRAGFVLRRGMGKGSHTAWEHPETGIRIILSGHDGDDAHNYQEQGPWLSMSLKTKSST